MAKLEREAMVHFLDTKFNTKVADVEKAELHRGAFRYGNARRI